MQITTKSSPTKTGFETGIQEPETVLENPFRPVKAPTHGDVVLDLSEQKSDLCFLRFSSADKQ